MKNTNDKEQQDDSVSINLALAMLSDLKTSFILITEAKEGAVSIESNISNRDVFVNYLLTASLAGLQKLDKKEEK